MTAHISCVCGKVSIHPFIYPFSHSYHIWPPPGRDLLFKSKASNATGVRLLRLSSGFLFLSAMWYFQFFGHNENRDIFWLQALQWAEVEGGPNSPLLCDLWYFVNRFTFLKVFRLQFELNQPKKLTFQGKELIKWYKLRESGSSVRCVAICCKSTLLVQHPAYRWSPWHPCQQW